MRNSLIALAAAGLIASTAAPAGGLDKAVYDSGAVTAVPAQYSYDPPRANRSDDRSDDRISDISERQERMHNRIERARADGRLSEWEARRLDRELGSIESRERNFRSDGWMTRWEADELNGDLDRFNNHLRSEIRD